MRIVRPHTPPRQAPPCDRLPLLRHLAGHLELALGLAIAAGDRELVDAIGQLHLETIRRWHREVAA